MVKYQEQSLLLEKSLVRETPHSTNTLWVCAFSQALGWMPDICWWIGSYIHRNYVYSIFHIPYGWIWNMAGPYSSMGDGHLVYNNEISYLIGTVNTRESRAGKGNVQIELQSRSPVLTRHCALQEPRGVWCGWSTEWGGERSALSWGYRDRQEPEQTEPFIFSMPATVPEFISSGFTFRLQVSYLFLLELWAWHAPHLGQLFFPRYWLLIHSLVPSSGPSSTTKNKNSKPNHQYGAPNGIDKIRNCKQFGLNGMKDTSLWRAGQTMEDLGISKRLKRETISWTVNTHFEASQIWFKFGLPTSLTVWPRESSLTSVHLGCLFLR